MPREARGLQVALFILGFAGLITATIASAPLGAWVSTIRAPHPMPFPTMALFGLAPPVASIALGVWAWRSRRVRRMASGYATVVGILALLIVAGLMSLSLVAILLT